jgi:hypothetical protein
VHHRVQDNMFHFEIEKQLFGLKPMNCPGAASMHVPQEPSISQPHCKLRIALQDCIEHRRWQPVLSCHAQGRAARHELSAYTAPQGTA